MPRERRPRRGSIAYKRSKAKKIVHNMISNPYNPGYIISGEPRIGGFACWKAGMTQITYVDTSGKYSKGKLVSRPVTILDAPSIFVCGIRYYAYANTIGGQKMDAHVIGETWVEKMPKEMMNVFAGKKPIDNGKKKEADFVRLLVCTQASESGMRKTTADLMEVDVLGRTDEAIKFAEGMIGRTIEAESLFKPGDYVDVASVTKGHGFTGPVKRYGIKIQSRKNQQHHRHVGCTGSQTPGKMDWRTPAAGQFGYFNRTELNKRIVMINDDVKKINPVGGIVNYGLVKKKYILIEGSVPGPRKRIVFLRKALRKHKTEPVEIKAISLLSQQ